MSPSLPRRRRSRSDDGIALPAVLGLGVVMVLLVGVALGVVTSGLQQASTDQDYVGALDAAFAGAEDYMARLDLNPAYVADGNPNDTAFGAAGDRTADSSNLAFGIGATGTWATVADEDGKSTSGASYRYEVDNSDYAATGIVRLRSTGRVGSSVRSIVADVRVDGFFRYIYFTDFETSDPDLTTYSDPRLVANPSLCAQYAWAGRNPNCGTIQFMANDNIYGPLHSNDTILSCGATFWGPVTTASNNDPLVAPAPGCASNGTFKDPGSPSRASLIGMPDSNKQMLQDAEAHGCVYTGPTTITYNADGTMTVVSPWTRSTYGAASLCGDLPSLHSTGARVAQLSRSLLFVQDVPRTFGDPNFWAASGAPPSWPVTAPDGTTTTWKVTCLGADGRTPVPSNGSTGQGWTLTATTAAGDSSVVAQHPLSGEVPATGFTDHQNGTLWSATAPAYGCAAGDLYTSGTVSSRTTVGASNHVWVTGDVTVSNYNKNVFGIVGQNGVLVYNPMKVVNGGYTPMLTDSGREIDAAILVVAHTFEVENFDKGGKRGQLSVNGSIGQEFRGPVGTGGPGGIVTGYTKYYQYANILRTVAPPYFLKPSSTTYSIQRYASVAPAFNADGSVR